MKSSIAIKGIIVPDDVANVYSYLGYDVASPSSLKEGLDKANGDDVIIEINSPGGYVDAGSEMYTALKKYPGNITAQIVGQACSAASWIPLAADRVEIAPVAQIMIHRSSVTVDGNSDDLSSYLQMLDNSDRAFVDLYAKKTGMDEQEIYRLMCKETWIGAKDAVKMGFCDAIMFEEDTASVVNADGVPVLSGKTINRIKQLLIDSSKSKATEKKEAKDAKPKPKENVNKEKKRQLDHKLSLLFGNKEGE